MSWWTFVHGTITVSPMGRTQAELRYILETVLDHLPRVTGSERDMNVYVIQKNGHNSSCSCDEFFEETNNLKDFHGRKSDKGWLQTQDEYILVVDGNLRDRMFDETVKEFMNWLCRLSRRIKVRDIQVKIKGYGEKLFLDDAEPFRNMFVSPSNDNNDNEEENWCEYLMWDYPRNKKGNLLSGKPSVKTRIKKEYEDVE